MRCYGTRDAVFEFLASERHRIISGVVRTVWLDGIAAVLT